MDFEQKLIQRCHVPSATIDPDDFIDRLRGQRLAIQRRKQRLFMGSTMVVFIALVGVLSVTQLQNPVDHTIPATYYSGFLLTAEEEQQLWEDMALYVLESEDDLWTALEFLDEVDFEGLTNLMEAN